VWRDDAQVVDILARKVYGERPGADITVSEAP
jgi:Holliday junction resolvase RusA-like endonuclease